MAKQQRQKHQKTYVSEEKSGPTQEMLVRRAKGIVECLRLYPHDIAAQLAKHPEANWLFGRLYLIGAINRTQYDAADRLSRTTRQYRRMLVPHGRVKGFNPEVLKAEVKEDLSDSAHQRLKTVQKRYEHFYAVLQDCGKGVPDAIFRALDTDLPTQSDLILIRRGLEALARYG